MVDAYGDEVGYVVEGFRMADDGAEGVETVLSGTHFRVC